MSCTLSQWQFKFLLTYNCINVNITDEMMVFQLFCEWAVTLTVGSTSHQVGDIVAVTYSRYL